MLGILVWDKTIAMFSAKFLLFFSLIDLSTHYNSSWCVEIQMIKLLRLMTTRCSMRCSIIKDSEMIMKTIWHLKCMSACVTCSRCCQCQSDVWNCQNWDIFENHYQCEFVITWCSHLSDIFTVFDNRLFHFIVISHSLFHVVHSKKESCKAVMTTHS